MPRDTFARLTEFRARAPATLAKKAVVGGGPAYKLAGKFPIYAQDDLDAWAKSRLSERVSSTSELSRRQAETAY
jgi:hypothetical protein